MRLACVTLVLPLCSTFLLASPANASRFRAKSAVASPQSTGKTAQGKPRLRQRIGSKLIKLGTRIQGTPKAAKAAPAPKKVEVNTFAGNALGADPARTFEVIVPKKNPALAKAMKTLRKTFNAIRAQERRLGHPDHGYNMYLQFDAAERLVSATGTLLGYKVEMVNHNGAYPVAETVYIHPNGRVAGTGASYGSSPGNRFVRDKLVGIGGVFEHGERTGYARAAIEALESQ